MLKQNKTKPVTIISTVFRREISDTVYTDDFCAPEIGQNFSLK